MDTNAERLGLALVALRRRLPATSLIEIGSNMAGDWQVTVVDIGGQYTSRTELCKPSIASLVDAMEKLCQPMKS